MTVIPVTTVSKYDDTHSSDGFVIISKYPFSCSATLLIFVTVQKERGTNTYKLAESKI